MNPGHERDNKLLLMGFRFALVKLGIAEDSPLWNWMQQEFQAWLTGGYEATLSQSIANARANAVHDFLTSLRPELVIFKKRSSKDEQQIRVRTQSANKKTKMAAPRRSRRRA